MEVSSTMNCIRITLTSDPRGHLNGKEGLFPASMSPLAVVRETPSLTFPFIVVQAMFLRCSTMKCSLVQYNRQIDIAGGKKARYLFLHAL